VTDPGAGWDAGGDEERLAVNTMNTMNNWNIIVSIVSIVAFVIVVTAVVRDGVKRSDPASGPRVTREPEAES
jgi:hypothetical protein